MNILRKQSLVRLKPNQRLCLVVCLVAFVFISCALISGQNSHLDRLKLSVVGPSESQTRFRQRNSERDKGIYMYLQEPIDDHNYQYFHNPIDTCMRKEGPSDVFILILVISSPGNHEQRQLIRRTYGRNSSWPFDKRGEIKTLFVLGVTDISKQVVIDDEAYRYGDIVQENFIDSYHNLTRKTVAAFKWASRFCRHANFVMKIDDDVMLHQQRLRRMLRNQPALNFSAGEVMIDTPVVRNASSSEGKWYLSEEYYPNQTYPPYLNGHLYVLSSDLVEAVYHTAVQTPLFPWEDVFVGICLQKLRVKLTPIRFFLRVNYVNFVVNNDTMMVSRMRNFIAVADISPYLMELMWSALRVETF
ncbi:beta-1,3-galactosyltransferase 5-like [Diadema antillarum]|uniref:beta-1,3-galactosyltransferase 5-like n=1 Tax=Diadema antillarum TaxID=105358 RepID=UPI003A862303